MPLRRLLPLLAALITLCTAVLVGQLAWSAWQGHGRARAGQLAVAQLRLALVAAEQVSRERGPTNGLLGEPLPPKPERVQALSEARARTDAAWDALGQALEAEPDDVLRADAATQLRTAREALGAARQRVDATAARPHETREPESIRAAVLGMVAVVPMLSPTVGILANQAQQALPFLSDEVQGARLSAALREVAGLLGSHFTAALARQQPFTAPERLAIERTRGRLDELRFLVDTRVRMPGQSAAVRQAWNEVETRYGQHAGELVARVLAAGETDGRYGLDPAGFAAAYVPDMNVMFSLRDVMLDQAAALAQRAYQRAMAELLLAGVAALLVLGVLAASIVAVNRRVLQPLVATTSALESLARNELDAPLALPAVGQQRDEMGAVVQAVHALRERTRERARLEQERDALIARLREQSNSDFLTGLPNRRAFFHAAEHDLALARRHGHGTVAILFDVDAFKAFNDRFGHAAGDRALTDVAHAVRRELRAGDLVGRYGGEEFVLLLNHTDGRRGLLFAERLRTAIAATPVGLQGGETVHVTVSLGVADAQTHGFDLEVLLSKADEAMYRAKQGGRNRCELA